MAFNQLVTQNLLKGTKSPPWIGVPLIIVLSERQPYLSTGPRPTLAATRGRHHPLNHSLHHPPSRRCSAARRTTRAAAGAHRTTRTQDGAPGATTARRARWGRDDTGSRRSLPGRACALGTGLTGSRALSSS